MTFTDLILFLILAFLIGSLFFSYYMNLQVSNRALAAELIEKQRPRERKQSDILDVVDRI